MRSIKSAIANLKVGDTIYEVVGREWENDYHPQEVTKINFDTVEVFEKGYPPDGKAFTVNKGNLFIESSKICH